MDTETEKIIKDQMKILPEEIKGLFTDPKVNEQILEIGKTHKLNDEQLGIFQMETFLLMLGLTYPDEYQEELKDRLNTDDETLNNITKGIYTIISNEKIEKLKEIYRGTEEENIKETIIIPTITPKPLDFDPRFMSMLKDVQEAIALSNWKEKLYEIAPKYKLNIEQMGILEEITVKVISNEIYPDKYEEELASKITISKEDISNLVKDVNEEILKTIRELLKEHWDENGSKEYVVSSKDNGIKEEVPIPPYAKIEIKAVETPKNIIEEKLKNPTVSERIVSDHSTPKISDPYREAF